MRRLHLLWRIGRRHISTTFQSMETTKKSKQVLRQQVRDRLKSMTEADTVEQCKLDPDVLWHSSC